VKEGDIVYERGDFWVHSDIKRARYTVFRAGITHSTSDVAFPFTEGGLESGQGARRLPFQPT
jgi:hypothetical protein